MGKTIGIPRGLFYYQYFPLWNSFFVELGQEIIVSENTNKSVLDAGVKCCVDEACLPVKVFFGHVLNIKDKVDYLFIPRLTSVSKGEYICPKFGGLPDMIKQSISSLPAIIDTEINLRKTKKGGLLAALEIGKILGFEKRRIKKAYTKALKEFKEFENKVKSGFLVSDLLDRKLSVVKNTPLPHINIAIISHRYNLFDSFINMNLIKKLKTCGANILTIDMPGEKKINFHAEKLHKKMFWYFGRNAVGGIRELLESSNIHGIIYLMAFGCGVDSFVCDLIERDVRRKTNTPFIILTIDEHSGEAGIDTRIEAFIDMINWRDRMHADISSYG